MIELEKKTVKVRDITPDNEHEGKSVVFVLAEDEWVPPDDEIMDWLRREMNEVDIMVPAGEDDTDEVETIAPA